MEILELPTGEWTAELTCGRCDTKIRANQDDLELDGFKVSGYHFAGTAVCEDRFFVSCPTDKQWLFVDADELPVVLQDRLTQALAKVRRERGY